MHSPVPRQSNANQPCSPGLAGQASAPQRHREAEQTSARRVRNGQLHAEMPSVVNTIFF